MLIVVIIPGFALVCLGFYVWPGQSRPFIRHVCQVELVDSEPSQCGAHDGTCLLRDWPYFKNPYPPGLFLETGKSVRVWYPFEGNEND